MGMMEGWGGGQGALESLCRRQGLYCQQTEHGSLVVPLMSCVTSSKALALSEPLVEEKDSIRLPS